MELFAARLFLSAFFLISSIVPHGRYLLWKLRFFLLPLSALVVFGVVFYYVRRQFLFWYGNEFTKVFVPPYSPTGIDYFLFGYTLPRLLAPYLVSFVAAYLFLFLNNFFNKKYGGRFFYQEEIYLAALAVFITGYPGLIYYFTLLFFVALVLSFVISRLSLWSEKRFSLSYLWLPLAAVVILIQEYAGSYLPLFGELKI